MRISDLLKEIQEPENPFIYVTSSGETLEIGEVEPEDEHLPTQTEINKIVEEKSKLQNQTHSDTCGACIKFTRTTPNPASMLGYCKWHGSMVNKNQASCDSYREAKRVEDPWNP